jgi:hypothetical protein
MKAPLRRLFHFGLCPFRYFKVSRLTAGIICPWGLGSCVKISYLRCISPDILVLVVMADLTGVGQIGVLQRLHGRPRVEGVAAHVVGFGGAGDARHMATQTVGKGVDRMGPVVVDHGMAAQTLAGAGLLGLESGGRHAQAVHGMAGSAGYALFTVLRLEPVDVLLMV